MTLRLVETAFRASIPRDPRAALLQDIGGELQRALGKCHSNVSDTTVHDVRVAARRLRAVMKALRGDMRPDLYESLRFDLRQIGRTLAAARAASVRRDQAAQLFTRYRGSHQSDGAQLNILFVRMVERCHRELKSTFESERWRRRNERIARHLRDEELFLTSGTPLPVTFRQILRRSVRDLRGSASRRRRSIEGVHRQRVDIKNARYVIESFAPLVGIDARRSLTQMRAAQNELGAARDWGSLGDWLHAVAIATPLHGDIAKHADKLYDKHARRFKTLQPALCKRLKQLTAALA
jgi:CHAD domain-containing protein